MSFCFPVKHLRCVSVFSLAQVTRSSRVSHHLTYVLFSASAVIIYFIKFISIIIIIIIFIIIIIIIIIITIIIITITITIIRFRVYDYGMGYMSELYSINLSHHKAYSKILQSSQNSQKNASVKRETPKVTFC